VKLERRLDPVPQVAGEDGRLRQVIMNLALNALEASPSGGRVTVTTSPRNDHLVAVTIDDSGPGVPKELRERIFEPFFTTKAQGSGLGLPIVHAIVTQHGGRLTVGDAPSRGARFTVELPRVRRA
jgi:signal transduction histidine kinase